MNIGPRTLQQTSAACLPCSGDLSTADSAGPVCLPVARTEYTVPGFPYRDGETQKLLSDSSTALQLQYSGPLQL